MSFNGVYSKCRACMFDDKPESAACVGCYSGRNFRVKRDHQSKVSYADMSTRDGRRSRVEYKKYLYTIIEKVIFNPPATIVMWSDGYPKTVVKCQPGDVYDKEKGLAMCIAKRCTGNTAEFCNVFKKWCGEIDTDTFSDYSVTGLGSDIKNTMIVTMSIRGANMHNAGEIRIPNGPCDNTEFAKWVRRMVDVYFHNHEHYHKFNINFDAFMTRRLQEDFHIPTTKDTQESRKELRDELLVKASGELQYLMSRGFVTSNMKPDELRKYTIEVVDKYVNNPDEYPVDFLRYIDCEFKTALGPAKNPQL